MYQVTIVGKKPISGTSRHKLAEIANTYEKPLKVSGTGDGKRIYAVYEKKEVADQVATLINTRYTIITASVQGWS